MHVDLSGNPVLVIVILLAVGAIFLFIKHKQKKFKTVSLLPIMKRKFPGCRYEPGKTIERQEYKDIGCLKVGSQFGGDDLLYAKTDSGLCFRYCEVDTYTTYSNGSSQHRVTYFDGAIVSFGSDKLIESCFYVVSKTSKAKSYFHRKFRSGIDKSGTENALFDEHFRLYTDNLSEAFVVLKPQNLEKLIAIKEKYKNLIIAFRDRQVHIILPGVNLFKAPTFNFSTKNKAILCEKCCDDLAYLVSVINDFDYFE